MRLSQLHSNFIENSLKLHMYFLIFIAINIAIGNAAPTSQARENGKYDKK